MTYSIILSNVKKHISLKPEEQDYFTHMLKEQKVPRKEYLLSEGTLCKHINFVNSGVLRAHYTNNQGKESTVMFALSDWWITDMFCFINQKPAMLSIQAVSDSHIFQLSKRNLDELYQKVPQFEKFFRIIMQNAYIREQLRVIENLSLSADERYNNFLSKYPQIAQSVTQKQIASYLGITPEFLSTIRGKKSIF